MQSLFYLFNLSFYSFCNFYTYILNCNNSSFLGNSVNKFFASRSQNNLAIGNFQIIFGNRTLKRIDNRSPNKPIKVRLEFRIYKPLISSHAVDQRMHLIFDFIKTIRSGGTNWYYFVDGVKWRWGNYFCKSWKSADLLKYNFKLIKNKFKLPKC